MKAVKKIFSSVLIFMIFLHANYLTVYYSLYEINTENLTALCCEKKVENCNAHCYLDKKMSEEDNKNNNSNTTDIKLKLTEYIVTDFIPEINYSGTDLSYSDIFLIPLKDIYSDIVHPPQL